MAINPLLQWLVNTAKTSATVVKKNTEKKAKNALWWLVATQKETMPQARAKALLPQLTKVAETTGKIWQANVAKKQEQAKELLSGMTATVNQWFVQAKDTALNDLQTDVTAWMPKEELRNFYPDIPENVVEDLYTDLQAGMPIEEAKNFYPEIYALPKVWQKQEYVWPNISIKWFAWQEDWWIIPNIPRFESTAQDTTWGTNLDYIKWFGKNLLKSTWNLAIDIANAWLNVLEPNKTNTAYQLASVWAWAGANLLWLDEQLSRSGSFWQEANQKADMLWGMFKERYGSMENISKTAYEDPTWVFSDALSVIWAWWSVLKAGTMWSKAWVLGKVWNVADDLIKVWKLDPANKIAQLELQAVKWVWKWIAKIPWAWAKSVWWVLWKATWTSADTIKQVYKSAAAWSDEAIKWLRWKINDTDILASVEKWVDAIKSNRKELYWQWYNKLVENKTIIDTKNIWKELLQDMYDDIWITFDKNLKLDFSQSKITSKAAQQNLTDIVNDLKNWKDNTPAWLDTLKQRISDYARYTPEFAKSDRFATMVSNKIKDKIIDVVPEYKEMMKNYWQVTNLLNDIKWAVSVWWKTKTNTAITKLKSVLRDNQEFRKAMVQEIEKYSGKDIIWQIAWSQMSSLMPKWLAWVWLGIWAGVWGAALFSSIASNPFTLIPLLLTSPRLVWEIANAIWVSVNKLNWYKNFITSKFKNANIDPNNIGDMNSTRTIMPKGDWWVWWTVDNVLSTTKTRTLWQWATVQTKRPLSLLTKNANTTDNIVNNTSWKTNKPKLGVLNTVWKKKPTKSPSILSPKKTVQSDTLVSKSDEMEADRLANLDYENNMSNPEKIQSIAIGKEKQFKEFMKKLSKEWKVNPFTLESDIKMVKEWVLWEKASKNILEERDKYISKVDNVKPSISKDIQPLYDEAKRYKSADEFIDTQEQNGKILYHWTDTDIKEFSSDFIWKWWDAQRVEWAGLWKWIYLTNKPQEANFYAKLVSEQNRDKLYRNKHTEYLKDIESKLDNWKISKDDFMKMYREWWPNRNDFERNKNVIKSTINWKIANKDDIKLLIWEKLPKKYIDNWFWKKELVIDQEKINNILKENWFVWRKEAYIMWWQRLWGKEEAMNIVVFDPKNIKTESQLRKIREEANRK